MNAQKRTNKTWTKEEVLKLKKMHKETNLSIMSFCKSVTHEFQNRTAMCIYVKLRTITSTVEITQPENTQINPPKSGLFFSREEITKWDSDQLNRALIGKKLHRLTQQELIRLLLNCCSKEQKVDLLVNS